MPAKHTIIPGTRYSKLTVLKDLGRKDKYIRILVKCDCGKERIVRYSALRSGNTTSCGCSHVKHGYAFNDHPEKLKKRTYKIWSGILQRCLNPNGISYKNYGGRGISICDRWRSFDEFLLDMGEVPTLNHSIERIDVDGNYQSSNCKWILLGEQSRNRRNVRKIEFNGKTMTIADWAREMGLGERSIWMRLSYGWSVERALTTKSQRKNPAAPPKIIN